MLNFSCVSHCARDWYELSLICNLQSCVFGFGCSRNRRCSYLVIFLLFYRIRHLCCFFFWGRYQLEKYCHKFNNWCIYRMHVTFSIIIPDITYFGMAMFFSPLALPFHPLRIHLSFLLSEGLDYNDPRVIILVSFLW